MTAVSVGDMAVRLHNGYTGSTRNDVSWGTVVIDDESVHNRVRFFVQNAVHLRKWN